MKKKFLTAIVLASSFAFFNCGDDAASAPVLETGSQDVIPGDLQPSDPSENPGDTAAVPGDILTPPDVETQLPGQVIDPADNPADSNNPGVGSEGNPDNPSENPAGTLVPPSPSVESSSSVEAPENSSSSVEIPESSSSEIVAPEPTGPILSLAANADENKDGPYKVNRLEKTGPDGGAIWAWPDVSSDPNVKYPVVIWGPGGGTEPGAYGGMINRLVSHGFVVLALSSSPGDASKAIAAINWLEEKNKQEGALKGRMILDKVGCSGHSMGGLESEQALLKDSRVYTSILNNSGDLGHSAMAQIKSGKPIAIVYGEKGMERPNAEADFNNPGVTTPACLIRMDGGPQNPEGGWGHGSGAWDGVAATLAWMRWHLGGEDFRKADFVGTTGKYIDGPIIGKQGNWHGTCKNW